MLYAGLAFAPGVGVPSAAKHRQEQMMASGKKPCVIKRCDEPVLLSGQVENTAWSAAEPIGIDVFPWYTGGRRQLTTVRALYDEQAIYLQFLCEDRHIWSRATELNGAVWEDSCVEMFAITDPAGSGYYNLEMNACGQMLMGFGPGRTDRKPITADLASAITLRTSVPGQTKDDSPDDNGWWLAARVPFETIEAFTGQAAKPSAGSVWRGNFYRCGGKTDSQHACWNPIVNDHPDFHRPEFFGELVFA